MKNYIVATRSDFTIITRAKNEQSAVNKANKYYKFHYGETRGDFTAYDLDDYLSNPCGFTFGDVLAIRSWTD